MIETEQSTRGAGIRLQLEHFEDGWGWGGWEECVGGKWHALLPPAQEN
jgi:hypothetical protein